MNTYSQTVANHLAAYKARELGAITPGLYSGREYPHILPVEQRELNLIKAFRSEIVKHISSNPAIVLHKGFHHLNSSQAFALNLFFPAFSAYDASCREFFGLFGSSEPKNWCFEYINEPGVEGTNVDVHWGDAEGRLYFVEVKYTENEFGQAEMDDRHMAKLQAIYSGRLSEIVHEALLDPVVFFPHYQILRNISLLHSSPESKVIFCFPISNEALSKRLNFVLGLVKMKFRSRILVIDSEHVMFHAARFSWSDAKLADHYAEVARKYLVKR